jgi:hypothetical protein
MIEISEKHPEHKGLEQKIGQSINWIGDTKQILAEMVAFHVDRVLGLYSVPPGKLVALSTHDVGVHWAHRHLCTNRERYKAYADEIPEGARMLGWLSVVVPHGWWQTASKISF